MAGFSVVVLAAFGGRTYRRWLLFTGGIYWQQATFNAIGEYVGLVAEHPANVGEYITPVSAFGGCLPCLTVQNQSGTRESA